MVDIPLNGFSSICSLSSRYCENHINYLSFCLQTSKDKVTITRINSMNIAIIFIFNFLQIFSIITLHKPLESVEKFGDKAQTSRFPPLTFGEECSKLGNVWRSVQNPMANVSMKTTAKTSYKLITNPTTEFLNTSRKHYPIKLHTPPA